MSHAVLRISFLLTHVLERDTYILATQTQSLHTPTYHRNLTGHVVLLQLLKLSKFYASSRAPCEGAWRRLSVDITWHRACLIVVLWREFYEQNGEAGDVLVRFLARMVRAVTLAQSLYKEVEKDQSATWQALAVVLFSHLAAGIGAATHAGSGGLVMGGLVALLAWHVWIFLTYILGAKLFPMSQTSASLWEFWRALGFASAPGILRVFGVVPGLTGMTFLVAAVWMLMTSVLAVRQVLDYASTARAMGVCVPGWLVYMLLLLCLLVLLG